MEAYKVVAYRNNKMCRVSCGAPAQNTKYELHYKKDEITEEIPGSLGIFCFATYTQAFMFLKKTFYIHEEINDYKIIKVKGINLKNDCLPHIIPSNIEKFYTNGKESYYYFHNKCGESFPLGTIRFEKVLCLE